MVTASAEETTVAPRRLSYRELVVWQRGMDLVVTAHDLAQRFPSYERYGLASQLRRAAVSIPANIAEGHGRLHRGDFVYHLSVANGSLRELETHVQLAVRLEYIPEASAAPVLALTEELGRMLSGLIRKLRSLPSPLSSSVGK
jgi:four helix bundle protein